MQTINVCSYAYNKIYALNYENYETLSPSEKICGDNGTTLSSIRFNNLMPELRDQLIYKIIQNTNASQNERDFLDKCGDTSLVAFNSKYMLSPFIAKIVDDLYSNADGVKRSDLIATLLLVESFRTNKNKIINTKIENELRNRALFEFLLKERIPYINFIAMYEISEEILTDILSNNDYHVISRMKISSPAELTEKYGEKLAFKISKYIWYISDIGYILIPYKRTPEYKNCNNASYYEPIKRYGSVQFERYIENRNNLDYFLTPFSEEFKDLIYQIAYNESEEEVSNRICDYLNDIKEEQANHYKQLVVIQSKGLLAEGRLYDTNFTSTILANCKSLSSSIIKYSNQKYSDYLDIRKQLMLATISADNAVISNATKGIAIIEREMNRTDRLKYVLNYEMQKDILKIYTGWVPAIYVDKTQLAAYLKSGYSGREDRKQYLEGYINGEYMIWTAPIDIAIKFSDQIYHGLKYDRFRRNNSINATDYLENGHQHYGSEQSVGCGNTGCMGTFAIGFADASATYNIPKMIALQLQYVQTLVPLDWAGDKSINNCIITDKNNKIVDACDQSLIGKYIDNSNPYDFYISTNGKEE